MEVKIKFYYESDGERTCRTHYVIAECDDWSDCKRLDCNTATIGKLIARELKRGIFTMEDAAKLAGEKWL